MTDKLERLMYQQRIPVSRSQDCLEGHFSCLKPEMCCIFRGVEVSFVSQLKFET